MQDARKHRRDNDSGFMFCLVRRRCSLSLPASFGFCVSFFESPLSPQVNVNQRYQAFTLTNPQPIKISLIGVRLSFWGQLDEICPHSVSDLRAL